MNDQFMQWAQHLVERDPRLRDSDTVRSLVEEFNRFRLQDALRAPGAANDFAMRVLQGVEGWMPSRQFIAENVRPLLDGMPRPTLPDIQLPSIDLPRPTFPTLDLPSASMPSLTGQQLASAVIAILAIVAVFAVANRIWHQGKTGQIRLPRDGKLRPLLVHLDPKMPIGSRQDLVRAFESLSVRRLGELARNWNHRIIADELGGAAVDRRRVATHLASLYETARYAPENEQIPSESLRAAQREIAYLAEVENA